MKHLFLFLILLLPAFPPAVSAGNPLKIMTFNIRYDNPGDSVNQWLNRKERVAGLINNYHPDIIGLQEVLNNQYIFLQQNLNDYSSYGVGRDDGLKAGEYAPVFYNKSRLKSIEEGHFWLAEDNTKPAKGWDAACIRIVTWIKLKDKSNGDTVIVYSTHFDHMGDTARVESAKLIMKHIKEKAKNYHVIVCGDFNCTIGSPALQSFISGSFLNAAFPAKLPENLPTFTYHGFTGKDKQSGIIDFVFYRNFASSGKYQIITEHWGNIFPSDHFPVYTELNYL